MDIDIRTKIEAFVSAFSEETFQETIGKYRNEIERVLYRFLTETPDDLGVGINAGDGRKTVLSIQSRIKSSRSFEEKLIRKDYISEWTYEPNRVDLQKVISSKLPDLIGFRITCWFHTDEERLFNRLYDYIGDGKEGVSLDPKPEKDSESLLQENGHRIYKMTGKYKPKDTDFPVCFEVQIKSVVHNIWGEVEHKTIYKGKQFEIEPNHKKAITSEIYNVLVASDKQLESLFRSNHTETDLIRALFAEQTRVSVSKKTGNDYLATYYQCFFKVFGKKLDSEIRVFVANKLVNAGKDIVQGTIQITADLDRIRLIVNYLKVNFKKYYLDVIKTIAEEIISFKNMDEFMMIVADVAIAEVKGISVYADDENINNDSFGDDPDYDYDDGNNDNSLIEDACIWLNDALKRAKKGEK